MTLHYIMHADITQYRDTDPAQLGFGGAFENAVIAFMNQGGFDRLTTEPTLRPLELLRVVPFKEDEHAEPKGRTKASSLHEDKPYHPDHVHVWQVPESSLGLARLMNASRDDAVYKAIDRLVEREQQHFVYYDPVRNRGVVPRNSAVAGPQPRCLRVVHNFSRSDRVGSFTSTAYGMYAALAPIFLTYMNLTTWTSLGIYWSITGKLDTFTEFWQVGDELRGQYTEAELKERWLTMVRDKYPKGAPIDLVSYLAGIDSDFTLLEPFAIQDPSRPAGSQWIACKPTP